MTPKQKQPARQRLTAVTPAYLALVDALDRRREQLGLTHEDLNLAAELGHGHWVHRLHPDTLGGRVATWGTLDRVFAVLYPDGWRLEPAKSPMRALVRMPSEAGEEITIVR